MDLSNSLEKEKIIQKIKDKKKQTTKMVIEFRKDLSNKEIYQVQNKTLSQPHG